MGPSEYNKSWWQVFSSALQGSAFLDQNDPNVTPEKLVQNAKNIADAAVEVSNNYSSSN